MKANAIGVLSMRQGNLSTDLSKKSVDKRRSTKEGGSRSSFVVLKPLCGAYDQCCFRVIDASTFQRRWTFIINFARSTLENAQVASRQPFSFRHGSGVRRRIWGYRARRRAITWNTHSALITH
ncbi:hypothetical protein [Paraburkholderia tropica]|uniref:hypothetical protein n=1 Tax=Paraburkholderia tropica TaxID=92647 RepID=UPI001CC503AA|nr:hypothetical protein [Paraburkholderia tropica]